jgi:hypothetical protein
MQKRKFDELISYFNRKVSDMSIDQKYKMELLGMISAIGFAHEKELGTNLAEVGTDAVSRKAVKELAYSQIRSMYCGIALKEQREAMLMIANNVIDLLAPVASTQPEIVRCKDCQYWNKGSCECPEHAVNCQDYYVGDIETEAEHFCGYAHRRDDE